MKTASKKRNLIPAIILIIVAIAFIVLFVIVAYNWQQQSSEIKTSLTENQQTCMELGCPKGTIYTGSINSDKYYKCECYYAKLVKSENLICFFSASEAESQNYILSEC